MSAAAASAERARPPWWRALHQALMPDYNRKTTLYWWTMVLLGTLVLGVSVRGLTTLALADLGRVAAGVLIATLAGLFPVRVPRSKNSFAAGEIYIFLLIAIHGPPAAVVAAACEAGLGSYRTSKRWTSRMGSPAIAGFAMFLCGGLFQAASDALRAAGWLGPGAEVSLLMGLGAIYSFANSVFVSTLIKLKRNETLSLATWFREWGWMGLTYVATGALAALLFLTFQQFGITVLIVSVPMLVMFLATLHAFFSQQQATERHVLELQRSEKRFQSAFTHASIGMALVTTDGRVLQANRALSNLLQRDMASFAGTAFDDLLFAEDAGVLQEPLARVLRLEVETFSQELRLREPSGGAIWVALHCGFFADAASSQPCLIFQIHDITARRGAEGRLQHIAYHDSLTNLPNRSRFNECLLQALSRQRADSARHFAVMYLDFDRFKLINDSLGHGAGDEFLVKVAQRMREHLRPGDLLARLGGDEFAILTEHLATTYHAVTLAERLQHALRQPLQIAGKEIATSASIGITFSDIGYRSPDEVLRDADLAMYKAKAKGKAQYALFDSSLHRQATEQLNLEGDLRRAIEAGELALVFQPIYELVARRLVSFEALLRWNHPQRGLVSPATFIPLAEESGLIESLSRWVLEHACGQLHAWHAQYPAMGRVGIHVNASSRDFASTHFTAAVSDALERHDLRAALLTLEITENALMQRKDGAADTLAQLRELGVGLSIDDFGTGYSSLSYLTTLPISSLKIDRSFVRQLQGSAESSEIIRAVITLGASLGKQVVAEGIETEIQLKRLRELGCGLGQGYLLAEPLTPRQAGALLAGLSAQPAATKIALDPIAAAPSYPSPGKNEEPVMLH